MRVAVIAFLIDIPVCFALIGLHGYILSYVVGAAIGLAVALGKHFG